MFQSRRVVLVCAGLATLAAAAAPARAQRLSRAQLAARVDSIVTAAMAAERIPGVSVAVVRGTDTIVRGFGFADLENRVPASPATVYRLGSITKQFTALAILQLAEQGRLSLDDTLQRFVPSFPTPGRRITIRHLLNHTSGIPSYTGIGRAWLDKRRLDLPHDSLMALVRDRAADFAPGERFRYNNSGYYLLGMIIERVSGQSYGQYLQANVFGPLGLSATTYCNTRPIIPNRAQGYQLDSGGIANADFLSMGQPFAAGSLCSSVVDMLVWQRALAGDRLLRAGSYATMATPGRLVSGAATNYGFGLAPGMVEGHRRISHGGGINGFSTDLSAFPDDSVVVVVLANSEDANTSRIASRIAREAIGLPDVPVRDLAIAAVDRARYAGTYRLAPGFDLRIFERGDSVMSQATGQGAFRLQYQGNDEFRASFDTDVRIVFEVVNGRATALTLFQGGERRAPRVDGP